MTVASASGREVMAAPRRFEEIPEALEAGAAVLLLPALTVVQVRDALALVAGRATVEAAAADPEEARALAEAGVDVVRVAALTAAAPHAAVAFELEVGAASVDAEGLRLTAEALEPYPRDSQLTPTEAYRLRLRVEAASGAK